MSNDQKFLASREAADTLARSLGWFSLGLGALELFGAKSLCRWMGTEQHETLIRAYGAREIATGIGVLTSRDPTPTYLGARRRGRARSRSCGRHGREPGRNRPHRICRCGGGGRYLLDVMCAESLSAQGQDEDYHQWDYSDRSGLPRPPQHMRGAARDFEAPRDMRIPDALRPYEQPGRLASPGRAM